MKFLRNGMTLLIVTILTAACAEKDYVVTVSTSFGDVKMVLFDETPLHKESFITLAEGGEYDSTIFHRVIENFMVQGGDVNQKPDVGEPKNTLINPEFRPGLVHTKGMVAVSKTMS